MLRDPQNMSRTRIAILASTNATSSEGVLEAVKNGELTDVEIKFFLCNKPDCGAMKRAEENGIKAIFVDPEGTSREEYDQECMKHLTEENIDLVLLIGYMRILSKEFVDKWGNKCMNVHPSLLPAFGGGMDRDVHQEVLDSGVKITGCTIHFITEEADAGPIVLQAAVPITEDETVESLKDKVQTEEKKLFVTVVKLFSAGKIKIEGRKVRVG